jgi:lantibiotic modifying enzyme
MEHALSMVDSVPKNLRCSYYSGWVGIGFAAVRAGMLLGRPDLEEKGSKLLRCWVAESAFVDAGPLDVIGGNAGAVLALIPLARYLDDETLLLAAKRLSADIGRAAIKAERTWAWSTVAATGIDLGPQPLNGFAHGAAGMASALLSIGAAGSWPEMTVGGECAFRYEDSFFSEAHGGWPDLRAEPCTASTPERFVYGVSWCHGASGSGLARLEALRIKPNDDALRAGAVAAVRTVRANLEAQTLEDAVDASPCHGLAGLTELLTVAADVFADESLRRVARSVWQRLIERHSAANDWPSGLPSMARVPGLMLGTSGAGLAMLRVCGHAGSVVFPALPPR